MATEKSAPVKTKAEDRAMAADKQPRKDRVRPQPARSASPGPLQKASKYLSEVRAELKKTSWPSKPELIAQTQVVIGLLIVVGVFIAAWDTVLGEVFKLILRLLGVPNVR